MQKITRFVLWLCKNFSRQELENIIAQLQQILSEREPEILPRDDFRQQHPHYRNFSVDPQAPLSEPPIVQPAQLTLDWQQLCARFEKTHGHPLSPVRRRGSGALPPTCRCTHCGAPACYLYCNDGRQASQLRCKVCGGLSQIAPRHRPSQTPYWCPYCHSALYRWKQQSECTIYKCPNDRCSLYLQKKAALNWNEKLLQQLRLSQFKLRYQYRQYHFQLAQLHPAAPDSPTLDLTRIRRHSDLLGLVLAFHVSFALSARKTAQILRQVFGVPLSYQTVLNYSQAAAYYCHHFNLRHKARLGDTATGDETYIRVAGNITSVSSSSIPSPIRSRPIMSRPNAIPWPLPSLWARPPAPCPKDRRSLSLPTAIRLIRRACTSSMRSVRLSSRPFTLHQVLGLENRDAVSQQYRPFKQLIERLNRTYKYHVRSACGFATRNGAVALTTLFVTFYNFLRPHMALHYQVPVFLPDLTSITTLQGRWNKILQMALAA